MIIDKNNFFIIDRFAIKTYEKRGLFELWKNDDAIKGPLANSAISLITHRIDEENSDSDIPYYVFTKTSLNVCRKIKVTSKTLGLMNLEEPLFGQMSTKDSYWRFISVDDNVLVVQIYNYKDENNENRIGYSVFYLPTKDNNEYELNDTTHEFIQMITFLKFSDPDVKILPPGSGIGTKKKGHLNRSRLSMTIVDSTWNTTVIRNDGFQVMGHIRLQACGERHSKRKLVWIDPFEKNGYVRIAKSELNK